GGQDFDVHVGRLVRAIDRILAADVGRTAATAAKTDPAAIEATPQIDDVPDPVTASVGGERATPQPAPPPQTEGAVDPPPASVARAEPGERHRTHWSIGFAIVALLAVVCAGGWWAFVEVPGEMARREAAAAQKARAEEQAQQAAAEQARQAAVAKA